MLLTASELDDADASLVERLVQLRMLLIETVTKAKLTLLIEAPAVDMSLL